MEPTEMMEPRFTALPIISAVLKVLAVIIAIIGVISAIAALFANLTVLGRLGTFIGILITAAVQALLLWAGAELILLLVALEHNTYMTKEVMTKGGGMRAA